jgi:hypothetical protein
MLSGPLTFGYTFESTDNLFSLHLQVDMSNMLEEAV